MIVPRRAIALVVAALLAGCAAPAERDAPPRDEGDALPLPRLAHDLRLDGFLDEDEWAGALEWEDAFEIRDGTLAEGRYPFRLLMGLNATHVRVGALVQAEENPWTVTGEGFSIRPDALSVMLLPGLAGNLSRPSDWKFVLHFRDYGIVWLDGAWYGEEWDTRNHVQEGFDAKVSHTPDSLTFEITFPLDTGEGPDREDVPLGPGSPFRLVVLFTRQGGDSPHAEGHSITSPTDAWPGKGYNPYDHYWPDRWLKLRVPD